MSTFLDKNEIQILTGRKMKTRQIESLRRMGVPFFINACGNAIVTRSAIEQTRDFQIVNRGWKPNVLK